MNKNTTFIKGFSLLEILLVLTLLGILFSSFLFTLNPRRISIEASDNQRKSDALTIYQALQQYALQNNSYPLDVQNAPNNSVTEICKTSGGACSGRVDISTLIPQYLANIPSSSEDANGSGFYLIKRNNRPYIGGVNELDGSTFIIESNDQNFTP